MKPDSRPFILAAFLFLSLFPVWSDEPTSVDVGAYVMVPNNNGDTWAPAWTRDNRVFTPSDDSTGFGASPGGNIHMNEVTGNTADALNGATVNPMQDYGPGATLTGPDKMSWKSSGCIAVDGVLYWVVARHRAEPYLDKAYRQIAKNASIIKSVDAGKTWTRPVDENIQHPMFPGSRFATPYFIQYGQDGHEPAADNNQTYVYALSNNGFWDNGDNLILGRVARSKMGNLDGKDWQFYTGGDGAQDASWGPDMNTAKLVLDRPGKIGMGGPVYVPKWKCYLLADWYYPAGSGRLPETASRTAQWDFYVAEHPWGPWKMIGGSHTWYPEGFYGAQVCPKFNSADGNTLWAFTCGDFHTCGYGPLSIYRLFLVPLTLK